jgi:hypothetical protein
MADDPDPVGSKDPIGGGRWKKNRQRSKSTQPSNTKAEEGKSLGRVPDLKTVVNGGPAVYTKGPNRGDEFKWTTKEIGVYIGRTYQNGGILQQGITTLKTLSFPFQSFLKGLPTLLCYLSIRRGSNCGFAKTRT